MVANRGFEKISLAQWVKDTNRDPKETEKNVKSYEEDIFFPRRATVGSSGYDLFSTVDIILKPSQEVLIPLGIKIYMANDEFFQIHPRSGMGFKYYLRLANSTGIIDTDYFNNRNNEGHCWAKMRNESLNASVHIEKGMGIAQGIFLKFLLADGDLTNEFRHGGFGSTDS